MQKRVRLAEFKLDEGARLAKTNKEVLLGKKIIYPEYASSMTAKSCSCVACGTKALYFGLDEEGSKCARLNLYGLDGFGKELKFTEAPYKYVGTKLMCDRCIKTVEEWKKLREVCLS